MSLSSVMNIAASGMSAQSIRMNTIASNMSNLNTVASSPETAYRARVPVFSTGGATSDFQTTFDGILEQSQAGVQISTIAEDNTPARQEYRPNHPLANKDGYVFLPDINMVDQMSDMISTSRSYESNAEIIKTTKQMIMQTLSLGE